MGETIRRAVIDVCGKELSVAISFWPQVHNDYEMRLVEMINLSTGDSIDLGQAMEDPVIVEAIKDTAERLLMQEVLRFKIKEVG